MVKDRMLVLMDSDLFFYRRKWYSERDSNLSKHTLSYSNWERTEILVWRGPTVKLLRFSTVPSVRSLSVLYFRVSVTVWYLSSKNYEPVWVQKQKIQNNSRSTCISLTWSKLIGKGPELAWQSCGFQGLKLFILLCFSILSSYFHTQGHLGSWTLSKLQQA